jgi:hypothetical protein
LIEVASCRQNFIPMSAYLLDIQPVTANHGLKGVIGGITLRDDQLSVAQVLSFLQAFASQSASLNSLLYIPLEIHCFM